MKLFSREDVAETVPPGELILIIKTSGLKFSNSSKYFFTSFGLIRFIILLNPLTLLIIGPFKFKIAITFSEFISPFINLKFLSVFGIRINDALTKTKKWLKRTIVPVF